MTKPSVTPTAPDTREELFRQKALTYLVCFIDTCPRHAGCLRWQVGRYTPGTWKSVRCVNPLYRSACDQYVSDQPVLMARGMTKTFTDLMPPRVTSYVRQTLMAEVNRPYYYRYRNGQRLIAPALQQHIRDLFRQAGWTEEIQFDEYVEDYDW